MTIEHINGIYYRHNRTEYSYGGERFQKIDKDAPEAVRLRRPPTVLEGYVDLTFHSESDFRHFVSSLQFRDTPKPDVTYGTYARIPLTPKPLAQNEWRDAYGTGFRFRMKGDEVQFSAMENDPDSGFVDIGPRHFPELREAAEAFKARELEKRPLKANEWRSSTGKVYSFQWVDGHAEASDNAAYWWNSPQSGSSNAVRKALISWASKPENLPHHIAIANGIPYLMKDDEARTSWGVVSKIADDWKSFPLDRYDWQPGQRERVEKWRASQEKKARATPSVDVVVTHNGTELFSGPVIEYSINRDINDGLTRMSLSAIEKPKASQPKPLADDEVVIRGYGALRIVHTYSGPGGASFGLSNGIIVYLPELKGQSLTNARNYAKKNLKLAPDEYLCEESWTVKKRERWVLNYTTTREFLGRPTLVRITETEIFPGEE